MSSSQLHNSSNSLKGLNSNIIDRHINTSSSLSICRWERQEECRSSSRHEEIMKGHLARHYLRVEIHKGRGRERSRRRIRWCRMVGINNSKSWPRTNVACNPIQMLSLSTQPLSNTVQSSHLPTATSSHPTKDSYPPQSTKRTNLNSKTLCQLPNSALLSICTKLVLRAEMLSTNLSVLQLLSCVSETQKPRH